MLFVAGRIKTNPALVNDLFTDLQAEVANSVAEDGCIFYSFGMEDAAKGNILTLQIWRDEAALAAHLALPNMGTLVEKWQHRFEVQTKLYDASNARDVGVWNDPKYEALIRKSRE